MKQEIKDADHEKKMSEINWVNFWKLKYLETLNELRASNRAIARLVKKRKPRAVDIIEFVLGSPTSACVDLLEGLVAKHSHTATDAPQRTHVYTVYSELLDYVKNTLNNKQKNELQFDHVISSALVISWILAAWALAAIHAKAHDKKRPVKERRIMLIYEQRFAKHFAAWLISRPELRYPWPGQEWENPFTVKEKE